ncbi:hypothetical protein ABFW07_10500 [Acinetobacter soli]|uniref:hypothetical protein n=1 Tax=Acinetobacter soli TaxID=487316 RepID=UPI00321848AC
MNAYIFINNISIEMAESVIGGAPIKATHIEVNPPHVSAYINQKNDWYWYQKDLGAWVYCFDKSVERVSIIEINQALKDFALVSKFGGLKAAKIYQDNRTKNKISRFSDLDQAIQRIEGGLSI